MIKKKSHMLKFSIICTLLCGTSVAYANPGLKDAFGIAKKAGSFSLNPLNTPNVGAMLKEVNALQSVCKDQQSFGALRIADPQDTSGWSTYGLSSPSQILRVELNRSKCFTLVDRNVGFNAAQQERELAAQGMLQQGHQLAAGQIRAADYILIPDIISQNQNAGGTKAGLSGGQKGLFGVGASRQSVNKNAQVVLSLLDLKTSEQIISVTAEAEITDKAYNLNASGQQGINHAAVELGAWTNTEIGRVIQEAYINAFIDMMQQIKAKKLIAYKNYQPVNEIPVQQYHQGQYQQPVQYPQQPQYHQGQYQQPVQYPQQPQYQHGQYQQPVQYSQQPQYQQGQYQQPVQYPQHQPIQQVQYQPQSQVMPSTNAALPDVQQQQMTNIQPSDTQQNSEHKEEHTQPD